MSAIATYKIADHYKGDTFDGVQFTLLNSTDNIPINLTGCAIKIQFKKSAAYGTLQKEITNTAGITIVDAVNGVFKIDAFLINWSEANYYYDIEITFPNGLVKTYIKGTLAIIRDVTN